MKYSIAVKFIAVTLCALSIISIAACSFGILFMEAYNLYNEPLEDQKQEQLDSMAQDIAWYCAQRHAAETLSNCPMEILDKILSYSYIRGDYAVEITESGQSVYSLNSPGDIPEAFIGQFTIAPNYPIISYQYTVDEYGNSATEDPAGDGVAAAAATAGKEDALARVAGEDVIFSSEHYEEYWDEDGNRYHVVYTLNYYQGPEYKVTVYLAEQSVLGTDFALMSLMYPYRDAFIPILLISLLIFAVMLVYLCVAAGRTRSGEIRPGGLNRLPLDLYAACAGGGILMLLYLIVILIENYYNSYYSIWDNLPLCMLILGLGCFAIALLAIGLLCAFAAQVKVKNGYWWRHSVCGFLLRQVVSFLRWVRRGLRYMYRGCRAVARMLPVIWQWLLTAGIMAFALLITSLLTFSSSYVRTNGFFMLLLLIEIGACVAVVCYGGYCFGVLLKGAKHMAQGNLNHQIPTEYLFGTFKEFAVQLNSLAGAAQVAAQRQMKSERMKTELITNVSHDIKTPLTSIINYVDLMKKPHTQAQGEEYLEVLDRQSQRLKKLVDDLMEMSKASSGNLTVELGKVDAAEAINQALGEFSDKLTRVNLTPVFRHPDHPVTMLADGRLVWRVLSNILNNAVKYALPDTRLYLDLMVLQGNAVIAIKNISRDQLNVNADELMERFVRGDSSRNTEGSGLGLNIAKSLVELQHGQMHLMVDGDLFKVTLIFPCG